MKSVAKIVTLTRNSSESSLTILFKALGDDLRLQILRVMAHDSFSVSELCEIFSIQQSALSHHLKVLVNASLLDRKKEGTATFYRRALPEARNASLREQIFDEITLTPIPNKLAEGILRIQRQREINSIEFFRGNVNLFREQQDLIVPWTEYSEISLQLLNRVQKQPLRSIVEVGVGEGRLLPHLDKIASKVIALDLSPTMLSKARAHAGRLNGIRFVTGSTKVLVDEGLRTEAIVANMVLHHTSSPSNIIGEAAQLLSPGGALIISELCAHDQAWARQHCGDLWLGFTPEQIQKWAKVSGLKLSANVFLAQRNGFQVQVQLFVKTVN